MIGILVRQCSGPGRAAVAPLARIVRHGGTLGAGCVCRCVQTEEEAQSRDAGPVGTGVVVRGAEASSSQQLLQPPSGKGENCT